MTSHTLEKPNDWWRLHLPLVISLKLTHIPVTYPRYDIPPHSSEKCVSVIAMGGRAAARRSTHTTKKILDESTWLQNSCKKPYWPIKNLIKLLIFVWARKWTHKKLSQGLHPPIIGLLNQNSQKINSTEGNFIPLNTYTFCILLLLLFLANK